MNREKMLLTAAAVWLLLANLTAFALMGIDKHRARKGKWRIRERTLFLWALLGGGAGAVLGMQLFHHKTKHWYFALFMPLILLAQAALLVYLIWRFDLVGVLFA